MPKQGSRAEVNTFVKGLITEASPLNFPANASSDEENFELHRDGTRSRRAGMDFEENHAFIDTTTLISNIDTVGLNTFKWSAVEGDALKDFLVVQVGSKLYFFNNNVSELSSTGYVGQINISFPATIKYSFASVNGKLIIGAGQQNISVVFYTSATNTFTSYYYNLLVRDFWGVETGLGTDDDPTLQPISNPFTHMYNLRNQSWGIPRRKKLVSGGTTTYPFVDPVVNYQSDIALYPSNSEVVWTGLQFQPIVNVSGVDQDPYERMFNNLYRERFGSSGSASRGYFIIDPLMRGGSRLAANTNNQTKHPELLTLAGSLPADTTPGGASVITEFAGRVFFAGFSGEVINGDKNSPHLNNYVLFSQLVKGIGDIYKCYQEGDPTSREDSDVVETDGGFIRIAGAKNIVAMRALASSLVVFADNGVWSISGGSNFGFSATNYKVDKISSSGCVAETSVITEGGQLLFWADDGIYAVTKNQFGDLVVNSLSAGTIQTLYDGIPASARSTVRGEYDLSSKKIRWIYRTGASFTADSVTKELVLDTSIGAFYQNKIYNPNTSNLVIMGMFTSLPFSSLAEFQQTQSDTDNITDDVGNVIGVTLDVEFSDSQSMRYLVLHKSAGTTLNFTFSSYNNSDFRDWVKIDSVGVDAAAYLLTGELTANDSAVAKQVPYLVVHMNRTEKNVDADGVPMKQSSCLMRSQWDWANSILSKKFGRTAQVYKYRKPLFSTGPLDTYDNGFDTVTTKNKLRGRGKAISIHFQTEPYKDCQILGWSLTLNGNGVT